MTNSIFLFRRVSLLPPLTLVTLFTVTIDSNTSLASSLTMGVASALPGAINAQQNPALAGVLESTEVQASPSLSLQNSFLVKYDDSGTIEKSIGLTGDLGSFVPGFVYKINPRLGIGLTEIAPPLKLNQKITGIPISLLSSTQEIDVDADVTLRGALGGIVGYRLSNWLSLGAKFSYRSLQINAKVLPKGGGDPLAIQRLDQTTSSVTAGIVIEPIPEKLRLGLSTMIVNMNKTSASVESSFVAQNNNGEGSGQSAGTSTGSFSQFVAGAAYSLGLRRVIAADIDYKAADKNAREFSLVDFTEKPVDNYNRLDFRATAEWSISQSTSLLAGFSLENASKGAGRRKDGDDPGSAGFGSADVIAIYTGQATLVPAQSFMGGVKMYFLQSNRRSDPREKKEGKSSKNTRGTKLTQKNLREKKTSLDEDDKTAGWIIGAGLGYRKASLGVDIEGELPGAYQQTRIFIPIEITRRF